MTDLRIGIPIIGEKNWLGGVHYIKSLVEAVNSLPNNERPRVFLVVSDHSLAAIDLHQEFFALLDGIIFFGKNIHVARAMLSSPIIHCPTPEELNNAVDFFYPLVGDFVPDLCSASWIYDFQHVYLPEFFPPDEITSRNSRFSYVAASAKLIVLSSKSAEQDFRRIFPGSKAVTRVLSFHSLPSAHWFTLNPSETQQKYSLPDSFLICCNQFWIHKNHRLLFEAMAKVVQSAPGMQLICTGATNDWRFRDYFPELTSFVEKHELQDRIRILGPIPRIDQIQLMRRSLAVIQPSLFEGWSSVVEEARMLGKTIILSDLAVHYEQAPDSAVYFDRHNAEDLAEKVLDLLPLLSPGPDHDREQEARKKSVDLVKQFGWNFCSIAVEAQRLFGKDVNPASAAQLFSKKAYIAKSPGSYPKISIVTPSFNQGQFLEECINSILSQNYPNLEYIIMDGGSSDNSVAIIKKYEKYLAYWQSRPDDGQYAAVNEGFRKTTGEIMTWLNSDDVLHPGSLETVADIFLNFPGVEWIMGRPNGIVQETKQFWIMDDLILWSREHYLKRQYKNPYIQQEGTFWKRSLWEKTGGTLDTDLTLAGDMELWARFFRYAQLHSVDALLGAFRTHSAQKTAISLEAYHREAEQIIDREIAFFSQGTDKTLLPAPPPISSAQIAALRGQTETDGLSEIRGEEIPGVKVSAIVSTYNSERFIRGCLEDLVNQTLYQQGGLEIIVVDSGSEQNERAVVGEFQRKHRGIHYLHTERRETVYAAWNRGIKAAAGRYITNANTDDRHRKDALEVMCNALENNPDIGLVYADVIITETENETFETHTQTGQYQWPDFDRTALSVGCFIGPQPLWRKSLHAVRGYFDESFSASGDWEFWLRIAEGAKFLHVREYLGLYLRSDKSLEHQNSGKRIEEDRSIYKTYIPKYLPAYDGYFTGMMETDSYPVHVYRYGQIMAAFGRYDEAISLYESFVKRNPAYQGFTFLLNDLKNAKVRHSEAQAPPTVPLPEEVMEYINQADRHIANNNLASAREAIQQALRHTSGHPQLAALLSNMLDSLNK